MATQNDRAAWLQGGNASCSKQALASRRPLRFVLLGAPGAGKGTQAELLKDGLGGCQLSTGDIFRAAKRSESCQPSPAVEAALTAMAAGELVSDGTVLEMVKERVRCLRCLGGIFLDGFPRTVAQAEALTELFMQEDIALDGVLCYDLPIDVIVARLAGRRTCEQCKAVYHVETMPSSVAGICDHCGGQLVQREDDRPEAVRVRMETYERSTAPLINYYRERGLLRLISAAGSPEEVFQRTLVSLKADGLLPESA